MIFFLRSIFAQTFLNEYIIYRIWKSKEVPFVLKQLATFIYGVEIIIYLTGFFFSEHLSVELYAIIQKISGIWVLSQVYLLGVILIFDLTFYLHKKGLFLPKLKNNAIRQSRKYSFIGILCFICLELFLGYNNFLHPEVETQTFSFNKADYSSVNSSKTYKLLVASDFHLGYIVDKTMLKKYVTMINQQQADIVVIDGDLIDYDLKPLISEQMDVELRKIKAPKGVFFIPGNHDYKFDFEERFAWIANAGMTILKDSVVTIDSTLILIGRDDRSRDKKGSRMPIMELFQRVDTTKPYIFFAHQPGDIRDAYKLGFPLTICGHTHGGQAFPLNLAGHILYTNSYGMQVVGKSTSYTTSGLGLSGFPLRIATRSEVVVFNINIY